MSLEEVKRFAEAVKKDDALQKELKAKGGDEAAVADFAKSKGFDFSADELKGFAAEKKGELSEEQLDKVAGGGSAAAVSHVVVVSDVVVV